jgi:hypothetical protein
MEHSSLVTWTDSPSTALTLPRATIKIESHHHTTVMIKTSSKRKIEPRDRRKTKIVLDPIFDHE